MQKTSASKSGFFNSRALIVFTLFLGGALLTMLSLKAAPSGARSGRIQQARAEADVANTAAKQALAQLQSANQVPISGQVSHKTGNYSFVKASGGVLLQDNVKALPKTRALAFLAQHGALVGMTAAEMSALGTNQAARDGSDLRTSETSTDSIGITHIRLNQSYKNVPVFGAQLIVHMNGKGITAVNGDYVPNISLSTVPLYTRTAASDVAMALLRKNGVANPNVAKTELAIYPMGLLEGASQVHAVLAYAVVVSGGEKHEQVWLDAQTGAILNRIPLDKTALYRIIYSPQYDPANPDLFVQRKEGDPPHPTPFVNNLYDFAGQTYNFYASSFGRDSYDGLGHIMRSVYLINEQCPNAYWNGESTNYCPAFDADDVVSHEWSHAYTQFTHGLIYSYQSGALNESYSDIFGETVDLLNGADGIGGNNNAQPYPNGQRWLVGEDLGEEVQELLLRDMYDPDRLGDPGKVTSSNYTCGSDDGGGVHTNSGVPNHGYALVVDGTQFLPGNTYNGQTITGIGITKAAAIYFRAEKLYQTPTTDFPAHAQALQTSCQDLVGSPLKTPSTTNPVGVTAPEVITNNDCLQVVKATVAVEMNTPAPCPFGPLLNPNPAPICTGAAAIFAEDWETADDGWTRTSNPATPATAAAWNDSSRPLRDFQLKTGNLPQGRTGTAIYAQNPPVGEPGGGNCASEDYSGSFTITSPTIAIPANADAPQLSFDHYMASETGVDGGQVEISVNGGAFQLLPQDQYTFNAPNMQYNQMPPVGNNTNPNPGEYAWTGTNTGSQAGSWGTTVVDLSSVAQPGNTINIRFTWSQDGCNGVKGWYVDNIRVFNCPLLEAPVLSTGADYQNPDPDGAFTLNWTRPPGATGPDVLQVSQTSCAPLISDDASTTSQWDIAHDDIFSPSWTTSSTKPGHLGNSAFWAMPPSEAGSGSATLTFHNPINIPSGGQTYLSFSEFYFNELDDRGFVEVSTNNGASWTAIYTNARDMGSLPDAGATAFANEDFTRQTLDLTTYSGQTIRLRFRYLMGPLDYFLFVTYGWYIDDIVMTNDNWLNVASTTGMSFLDHKGSGSYCYRVRTTYTLGAESVPGPFSNVVNVVVAGGLNPLQAVVSRKTHGAAGNFDINLPLIGTPGLESRSGGAGNNHTMIFTFANPVNAVDNASVTGTGSISGRMVDASDPHNYIVNLTGVTNAQHLTVTLTGVHDTSGGTVASVNGRMDVLLGDVNASGVVNSTDVSQTKVQSGMTVTGSNFRTDVDANGSINATDVSNVKLRSGTGLP